MKFYFSLLTTGLFFCMQAKGQINVEPPKVNEKSELTEEPAEEAIKQPAAKDEEIYFMVDVLPEYKDGGEVAFIQYITSYVHNHAAQPKDSATVVTGNMYIQFVIEPDGKVSTASIMPGKGINPAFDKKALEAVKKSQWKPASRSGMAVRYKKLSKITFR